MPTKGSKPARAKASLPTGRRAAGKPIGTVTHFYDRLGVGIVKLAAGVKLGEVVRFKGRKGEFVQAVTSLQFDHKPIVKAARGKDVGIQVNQKVEEGDFVYKATA